MQSDPIIIEYTYDAPAEKVWQALTDRSKMKEWYFDLEAFEPVPGFEFSFYGGKDGRTYKHLCRITEAVVNKKLAHTWRYDGYDGESIVQFKLFPEGNKTRVELSHTGLGTFPAENPDFARHNFVEGWTYIMGTSLKDYLGRTA